MYDLSYTDYLHQVFGWTDAQIRSNIIICKVTGGLSTIGSVYLVYDVLKDPNKRKKPYCRLVVGLSILDITTSFFCFFMGTWTIPKGYMTWSIGNVATCDAQGFLSAIGSIGSPLYNCSLAVFYLLSLKYNYNDQKMKKAEIWLHLVPWLISSIAAFVGLFLNIYTGGFVACWIEREYPIGCSSSDEIECVRGGHGYHAYVFYYFIANTFGSLFFVLIVMFITYKHVDEIERKAEMYSIHRFSGNAVPNNNRRSRLILRQGILYSLALFLVWLFPLLYMCMIIAEKVSYVVVILMSIFGPLQGFWNVLIYILLSTEKTRRSSSTDREVDSVVRERRLYLCRNVYSSVISRFSATTISQAEVEDCKVGDSAVIVTTTDNLTMTKSTNSNQPAIEGGGDVGNVKKDSVVDDDTHDNLDNSRSNNEVFCRSSKMLSWKDFDRNDVMYEEIEGALESGTAD